MPEEENHYECPSAYRLHEQLVAKVNRVPCFTTCFRSKTTWRSGTLAECGGGGPATNLIIRMQEIAKTTKPVAGENFVSLSEVLATVAPRT